MIWYVTLWTNDLEKSAEFYDKLLSEMWAVRSMSTDRYVSWSFWEWMPRLSVILPHNRKEATVWNGVMVALKAKSNEDVDKMYKMAIELGWTDEWVNWPRGDKWFYAGYFRDLDWNKLSFFNF